MVGSRSIIIRARALYGSAVCRISTVGGWCVNLQRLQASELKNPLPFYDSGGL